MAKELPYFKFEPAEYLTKNISFCTLAAQGLFINICSYYWQRNCILTKDQILRRLNYEIELNELITEGIIDIDNDDNLSIKFLDFQKVEVENTSKTNSKNGSLGGRPKKPTKSENKPTALFSLSETKGIREDKIIEYEIRENNLKENKENKEKYNFSDELFNDPQWNESIRRLNKINSDELLKYLDKFDLKMINELDKKTNKKDYAGHFSRWLTIEKEKTATINGKEKLTGAQAFLKQFEQ
jgi:hypothetical protein